MAVERMAVAVLDILGFREILRTEGPQEIFDRVMKILPGVMTNAERMGQIESGQRHRPVASAFSDTVIFYRREGKGESWKCKRKSRKLSTNGVR
jgi:hypothetical protein